jgi:Polyketide cyclase / dehydrase and lipid transport
LSRPAPDRYRFSSVWPLGGSPDDAFEVLRAVERYPSWWPEIREARRVAEDRAAMRVRSLLPYDLRFELIQEEFDRSRGVLRARLIGDLDGVSAWSRTTTSEGAPALRFDEDVRLRRAGLNRLAPVRVESLVDDAPR